MIRTINRTDILLPLQKAAWMWHPGYWKFNNSPVAGWAYIHGWYARGNWVGWMGTDEGAVALTVHNRMYDVTIIFLANGRDDPDDFINPLMVIPPNQPPGTSPIGQVWPCQQDPTIDGFDFPMCPSANY